jgi:kumamolisin
MSTPVPHGFTAVVGSERDLPTNAQRVKAVNTHERIEISVYLRNPAGDDLTKHIEASAHRPGQHLSREEYRSSFGAASEDIAKVEAFARAHHLSVVLADPAARKIVLSGTFGHFMTAFATDLHQYELNGQHFRGRSGALHVPNELASIIVGIFGLDDRPQTHPHLRRLHASPAASSSYTLTQIAQLYDFPPGLTGSGQCIGLIELGGGYNEKDLTTYFQQLGISEPQVVSVSVDGGQNSPGGTGGADGEVALDIEVVGSLAPGARIAVYFAPNTDQGFLDAISQAVHDTANNPSIISISWGGPESSWTAQAMQTMDQSFQAAAALGITVTVAAGDNGSSDGVSDGQAHVDFPASSSYVLACGGTRLNAANGQVSSEVVWNELAANEGATGGGVSNVFPQPSWQANMNVPAPTNAQGGRGVPDVAGDADPQTGYQVFFDGQSEPIGGTSAVAPLWAGLIALFNEMNGKALGYLNPFLYQNYQGLAQVQALRDVTSGNNGAFSAAPGWDACTGLGTPDGNLLLQAITMPPPQMQE